MEKKGSLVRDIITLILLVVLVVAPIRIFIAQPFIVDGESMYPTFQNGNYLIVDEISYRFEKPARGDVIVFRYPGNPSIFYIKRIVGLPGETVTIKNGNITITEPNGASRTLNEPFISAKDKSYNMTDKLTDTQYFVMGDNRPRSSDSRVWGPLPTHNIIGRVLFRLAPFNEVSTFPGAYHFKQIVSTSTSSGASS